MEFSPITLGFALALVLGLPVLATRGGVPDAQAEEIAGARTAVYASAALSLMILSAVAFGVAWWQDVPADRLGWYVGDARPAFAWAAGVAVAGFLLAGIFVRLGSLFGLEESPLTFALMPRTGKELRAFLVMVGVAAVGEEYLFRGFAWKVLAEPLGPWPAALLTSVSFGLSHGYQRTVGVVRASALGLLLTLPVMWTGSLFPAIVAHFWINAAIGVGGWKLLYPDDRIPNRNAEGEDVE
ncbi:MAG: CPBP family intramembrane glutamic endopeptidase [Gemmatimonadota bacterium]